MKINFWFLQALGIMHTPVNELRDHYFKTLSLNDVMKTTLYWAELYDKHLKLKKL